MNSLFLFAASNGTCHFDTGTSSFLGFPHWYEYLTGSMVGNTCTNPQLGSLSDIWLIVAAIIEILLHVAALVAVGFVIYAGITYTISQGNPEKTGQAKTTLINAIAGLVVAVSAAAIVAFLAGSIQS